MESIVGAAVQWQGLVFCLPPPKRHHDILHLMTAIGLPKIAHQEQGFLTNTGRYVNRLDALEIAKAAGQNPKMANAPYLGLFSEDLW